MSALAAYLPAGSRLRPGRLLVCLAALVAITIAAALSADAARVWLLLFAVVGAAPVGATVLLMIAALTGGDWAKRSRPVLAPLAAGTVCAALAFLPIAVALPGIYPWAADPSAAPAGTTRLYLNGPYFLLRAAVVLAGWSILGRLFGTARPSRLVAGLGLAFHGAAISVASVDWYLSVEPGYVSSGFPALVAIGQIATALAVCAVLERRDPASERHGDLGAFLVATQVGIGYLGLMAFIVAWYGDLPGTIDWYVRRAGAGWLAVLLTALAAGLLVPFAILLRRPWRRGGQMLVAAGASALAGLALHVLWLVGPAFGVGVTAVAAGCLVAPAAGLVRLRRARSREARRGE